MAPNNQITIMRIFWTLAGLLVPLLATIAPAQETIRLHSGLVSSIRHIPEPPGGFPAPLTQAVLAAARNGSTPVPIVPDPVWSPNLIRGAHSADNILGLDDFLRFAGWISNSSDPASQRSAIYTVDFNVREPVITSAELVITMLVDDTLGDLARGNSLFLNGQRFDSGISSFTRTAQRVIDVTGVLQPGLNVLYLPVINGMGPSGLCFGAEIRVNQPARRDVESIVLRSGVPDTAVTHYTWPVPDVPIALSEFNGPGSPIFAQARSGPTTQRSNTPRPAPWTPNLNNPIFQALPAWAANSDWISENRDGSQANSALYAIPFQVNSTVIDSALFEMYCAVDDALGIVGSNAVYVNGTPLPPAGNWGKQVSASRLFSADLGPLLVPGLNWLYLNVSDWSGGSGVNFAARILVNGRPGRADPGVAAFGTIDLQPGSSQPGVQGVKCQPGISAPDQPIANPINPANLALSRLFSVYEVPAALIPPVWTPSLAIPAEFGPGAVKWMTSHPTDPLLSDSTLYSFDFEIDAETIESATLTVYFAVDDTLSSTNGVGFWMNGTPVPNSAFGGFSSTNFFTADVTGQVGPGTNQFYVETSDLGLHEGIILSAEVRVNGGRARASGSAIAAIDDITGDGIRDLVIGNGGVDPQSTPMLTSAIEEVRFVDGATGSLIALVQDPAGSAPSQFGYSLVTMADYDGDGVRDVAVGSPGWDSDRGRLYVLSGQTGAVLRVLDGPLQGDRYGHAMDVVGDLNGDGFDEIAVGAPGEDVGGLDAGSLRVNLGGPVQQLNLTAFVVGPSAGAQLGTSISGGADFNGDGMPDVAVGAPGASRVMVYGGPAVSPVSSVAAGGAGSEFGAAVALSPDANGDGHPDLVVGAPGALGGRGAAFVYTDGGPNPQCILEQYGSDPETPLGGGVIAAGDVDGNGLGEIVIAQSTAPSVSTCKDLSAIFLEGTDGIFGTDGELRIVLTAGERDRSTIKGTDLNRDGRNELIVSSWNLAGASCLLTRGGRRGSLRTAIPSSFQVISNPLAGIAVRLPAPLGVSASTGDATRVIVSWAPLAASLLDRYEVLRDGVVVASVPGASSPSLADTPPPGSYVYSVRAVSTTGTVGSESRAVPGVRPFLDQGAAVGNIGGPSAEAILTVNGSTGVPERQVTIGLNQVGNLRVESPAATGPRPFILFAEIGVPSVADSYALPAGFGTMAFAPFTLDPSRGGFVVANSLFADPAALIPAGPTPFQFPVGYFAPIDLTFQAVVLASPTLIEVSNALVLRIR